MTTSIRTEGVQVGDRVFCTVTGVMHWMTVTEVKGKGARMRIRTDAFTGWGYPHNFTKNPPAWMIKSTN